MKRKLLVGMSALVSTVPAFAHYETGDNVWGYGHHMFGGMMGGTGMFGAGFIGLIYFALIAFVFSLIFWGTKKWLDGKK